MFKVLIWDYVGASGQWLSQVADKKDIEIVGTITPKEPVSELLLKRDAWDWLLIFEQGTRQFFDATIQTLQLPPDRVIYALDISSWLQNPQSIFELTDISRWNGDMLLSLNFEINRQLNKYLSCTVEGLNYIATSVDNYIIRPMYINRINYAEKNMKTFRALAKKYYGVNDSAGLFLDLGANIGTTGIYFTTKLAPNLKLIAFEPDAENFKLLRTNLILNDMGDNKATAVNCGLGDKSGEMKMYRNLENPGGNSVFVNKNMPNETIKIMPLDDYFSENKIAARDVKYIWIDTEGFEPQVLLGAKNLLRENPAPIFMEFNPMVWNKSGCFDDMLALLAENYSHLIHVAGNNVTLYPLEEMRTVGNPNAGIGDNGDIFLIRKGAID